MHTSKGAGHADIDKERGTSEFALELAAGVVAEQINDHSCSSSVGERWEY
jgi:hypothetical protein